MASRYDEFTLNNGQYVPQYAGSSLEVLNNTGEELSKRHYANIAEMSATELLLKQLKQEAISDDAKSVVENNVKQVQAELTNLSQNGAENSTAKVKALTNAFLGNEDLLAIKSLSGNYKKFLETKSKQDNPIYNAKKEQEILNSPVRDPETGKLSSVYARPFNLNSVEKADWLKQQDEVLEPLKPDTFQSDLMKYKPEGMPELDFLKSTTAQQLTKKKVNNYLFGNDSGKFEKDSNGEIKGSGWKNYKSTASYKQQSEILEMSDEEIAQELRGRGEAKLFSNIQKDFMNVTPKETGSGSDENSRPLGVEYGPGLALETTLGYNPDAFNPDTANGTVVATIFSSPNYFTGADAKADKQIKEYQDQGFIVKPIVSGSTGGASFGGYTVEKASNADVKSLPQYQKYRADVTTASEVFDPNFASLTAEQKEAYVNSPQGRQNLDQYTKDIGLRLANNPLYIPTTEKERSEDTKLVRNQLSHRTIYDPSTDTELQVTDKTGKSTERFKDALKGYDISTLEVTGKFAPLNFQTTKLGNDYAEGIEARVYSKEDPSEFKTLILTPSVGELESPQGKFNSVQNQLYRTLATKPGQWNDLNLSIRSGGAQVPFSNLTKIAPETKTKLDKQGITNRTLKARELYGNQKAAFLKYAQDQGQNIPSNVSVIQVQKPDGTKETVIGYENLAYSVLGLTPPTQE